MDKICKTRRFQTSVNICSPTAHRKVQPTIVVGLDFGTTFSGFAFAEKGDLSTAPRFFVDWLPLAADSVEGTLKPYRKTSSSLYYTPKADGHLKLKNWGWSAKMRHANALDLRDAVSGALGGVSNLNIGDSSTDISREQTETFRLEPTPPLKRVGRGKSNARAEKGAGEFVTHFKLLLGGKEGGDESRRLVDPLPEGLNAEQAISDYLSKIGHFALVEVNRAFKGHFAMTDLQ